MKRHWILWDMYLRDIFYNLGMIAVHIYKCFAKVLWKIKVAKEIGIILYNLFDPIVLSLRQIVTLEGEKKIQKLEGLLRPLPSLFSLSNIKSTFFSCWAIDYIEILWNHFWGSILTPMRLLHYENKLTKWMSFGIN